MDWLIAIKGFVRATEVEFSSLQPDGGQGKEFSKFHGEKEREKGKRNK